MSTQGSWFGPGRSKSLLGGRRFLACPGCFTEKIKPNHPLRYSEQTPPGLAAPRQPSSKISPAQGYSQVGLGLRPQACPAVLSPPTPQGNLSAEEEGVLPAVWGGPDLGCRPASPPLLVTFLPPGQVLGLCWDLVSRGFSHPVPSRNPWLLPDHQPLMAHMDMSLDFYISGALLGSVPFSLNERSAG